MSLTLIEATDPDDLAARAAQVFVDQVDRTTGPFVAALSGGSTPRRFHAVLAGSRAADVDWSRVILFLSDERALPPTHKDSNFRMVMETLVEPLGLNPANVHRPEADAADLDAAARAYEATLASLTTPAGAADLVVLGMGDDGHTASLFPGFDAPDGRIAAVDAPADTAAPRRLTMTFEALKVAKVVLVLVAGAKKASKLAEVFMEPDGDLPMQRLLRDRTASTIFIVDQDAHAELKARRPRS